LPLVGKATDWTGGVGGAMEGLTGLIVENK
jgi:hypothetical protein